MHYEPSGHAYTFYGQATVHLNSPPVGENVFYRYFPRTQRLKTVRIQNERLCHRWGVLVNEHSLGKWVPRVFGGI